MTGSSSHLDTVVVVESLGDVWPSEIVLPSATTQCIAATEMREVILQQLADCKSCWICLVSNKRRFL